MTEMRVNYMHICDYAFLDRLGKICIIGIFDNISAKKYPAIHSQFYHVSQVSGEAGWHEMEIKFIAPDQKTVILQVPLKSEIKVHMGNAVNIVQLNGVKFPEAGTYKIQVWRENAILGTSFIQLIQN